MKNNKKGFTLVELIVVICIIGILAAILVPTFTGFKRSNMIKVANDNAYQVYMAVQNWLNDMEVKDIDITSGGRQSFDHSKNYKNTADFENRPYMYLTSGKRRTKDASGTIVEAYDYNIITDLDDAGAPWTGWDNENLQSELKEFENQQEMDLTRYLVTSDIGKESKQAWLAKVNTDTYSVEYAIWTSEPELFAGDPTRFFSDPSSCPTPEQIAMQHDRKQLEYFIDEMGNKAVGCYPTVDQNSFLPTTP